MARNTTLRSVDFLVQRWLLRREYLIARTDVLGLQMKVRSEDSIGRKLFKYGTWEKRAVDFLGRQLHLLPGDVAFDIGANIGWFSLVLDRSSPAGVDIYAFEPDPTNFGLLRDNLRLNGAGKVHPFQQAVSDVDGVKTLHLYPGKNRGRHSLLPLHDGQQIQVEAAALDSFWEREGLGNRTPRLIKIDVEGYEYFAFKGARQVLARTGVVLMEYSPQYMRKAGIEPGYLLDLLTGVGLQPRQLDHDGLPRIDRASLLRSEQRENLVWQRD